MCIHVSTWLAFYNRIILYKVYMIKNYLTIYHYKFSGLNFLVKKLSSALFARFRNFRPIKPSTLPLSHLTRLLTTKNRVLVFEGVTRTIKVPSWSRAVSRIKWSTCIYKNSQSNISILYRNDVTDRPSSFFHQLYFVALVELK